MVHVASSMNGQKFEISWGALSGGITATKYVQVITCEQSWLFVQPLDEFGNDDGGVLWLAPGAVLALWPWSRTLKRGKSTRRKGLPRGR